MRSMLSIAKVAALTGVVLTLVTTAIPAAAQGNQAEPIGIEQLEVDSAGSDGAVPFPADGVVFGEPPKDHDVYLALATSAVSTKSEVVAEFDVGSGFVRFIDETDSVSVVIKGDTKTFRAASQASTLGELYVLVAPPHSRMPDPIADDMDEPIDIATGLRDSAGPTVDHEFVVGQDSWASGCDPDEFDSWESSFVNWHGFILGDAFSESEHYISGDELVALHGYFGTRDEVWFGVCMVQGKFSNVEMQRRIYGNEENGIVSAIWGAIPGTAAELMAGERYLYHNHSHYGPLRRSQVVPHGHATHYNTYEYFISGAAKDVFAPDDQESAG